MESHRLAPICSESSHANSSSSESNSSQDVPEQYKRLTVTIPVDNSPEIVAYPNEAELKKAEEQIIRDNLDAIQDLFDRAQFREVEKLTKRGLTLYPYRLQYYFFNISANCYLNNFGTMTGNLFNLYQLTDRISGPMKTKISDALFDHNRLVTAAQAYHRHQKAPTAIFYEYIAFRLRQQVGFQGEYQNSTQMLTLMSLFPKFFPQITYKYCLNSGAVASMTFRGRDFLQKQFLIDQSGSHRAHGILECKDDASQLRMYETIKFNAYIEEFSSEIKSISFRQTFDPIAFIDLDLKVANLLIDGNKKGVIIHSYPIESNQISFEMFKLRGTLSFSGYVQINMLIADELDRLNNFGVGFANGLDQFGKIHLELDLNGNPERAKIMHFHGAFFKSKNPAPKDHTVKLFARNLKKYLTPFKEYNQNEHLQNWIKNASDSMLAVRPPLATFKQVPGISRCKGQAFFVAENKDEQLAAGPEKSNLYKIK